MIMKSVFRFSFLVLLLAVSSIDQKSVLAQGYPNKTINFITHGAPGTGNEIIARILAQKLSESLGQPVVVESRVGASGSIATDAVRKAAPDGYTIFIPSTSIAMYLAQSRASYNLVNDFAPVCLVGYLPYSLVVPSSLPVKSIKELIDLAKSKPGQLNYGTFIGGIPQFIGEALSKAGEIDIVPIPYASTANTLPDLLGGRVQILPTTVATVVPLAKSAKVRVLGVTGSRRSQALPDVPTMAEAGFPTLDISAWFAVVAPAKTPKEIIRRLNTEIIKAMDMPDVKDQMSKQGIEQKTSTAEELGEFLKADLARWEKLMPLK